MLPRRREHVMNCQICGKPATVHVCQILGGRETDFHFCAQHAMSEHSVDNAGAKCQVCGKLATVHETGVVGGQKVESHYCAEHFEHMEIPPDHITDEGFGKALEALERFVTRHRRVPTREEMRELGFVTDEDIALAEAFAGADLLEPDGAG